MFKATLLLAFVAAVAGTDTCFDEHCSAKTDVMLQAQAGRKQKTMSTHAPGWVKGENGKVCKDVCETRGLVCDAESQTRLTTNDLVSAAFKQAGYTCKSFHVPRDYPGTPFSTARDADDCAPMLPNANSSVCDGNRFGHHAALCYCAKVNRTADTCESTKQLQFTQPTDVQTLTANQLYENQVLMTFTGALPNIDLSIVGVSYTCGKCERNGGIGKLGRINVERGTISDLIVKFSAPIPHDVQLVILDFDAGSASATQSEYFAVEENEAFLVQHGGLVNKVEADGSLEFTNAAAQTGPNGQDNPDDPLALTEDQKERSVTIFLEKGTVEFPFRLGVQEPGISEANEGKGRNFFISGATNAVCAV